MSGWRVWLFLLAVALATTAGRKDAHASVVRALSLGELARAADSIVVGKVAGVTAEWDAQHRRIVSTVEIDVEESWKESWQGSRKESWKGPRAASRRIVVTQLGGRVGDIEMTVLGAPSFVPGERSVLFLRGQRRFQVVGMSQGQRTLAWNEKSRQWFAQLPAGADGIEAGRDARVRLAKRQPPIALQELRAQVSREIGCSP